MKSRLVSRALVWLAALTVNAGSYTENFEIYASGATSLSNGATLSWSTTGTTSVVTNPVKELQFTRADVTDTRAALLLPDLDPGQPIRSFSVRWDALVFGNFPNAGAGFSLNLGHLGSTNLVATNGVQDIGYGTGLAVSVHTGTNFSPGMRLLANGTALITARSLEPGATWGTNSTTRRTFQVFWAEGKGVSVMLDGTMLFTNVPMTNYIPAAGDRLVWAARAGPSTSQTYRIDNISVYTSTNSADALVLESADARAVLDRPVVRMTARVNTLGLPTTMLVEVGTNTAYGTVVTNLLPAAGTATNVSVDIPYTFDRTRGLFARITVSNALHTASSGDLPFESHRFLSTFVQSYNDGDPGAINGATAWLDKDNDGWLDFIVTGLQNPYAMIGRFHFNPGVNPTNAPWPWAVAVAGSRPGIAVGDFDNDNRPDAFIAAGLAPTVSGPLNASISGIFGESYLLYGTDNRTVTFFTNAVIFTNHAVMGALAVASDFDRNGQQDILLIGQRTFNAHASNDIFAPIHVLMQNTAFGLRLTNNHVGLPYNWAFKQRHTAVPWSADHWLGQGEETRGQSTLSVGDADGDGFDDVFNLGFGDSQRLEYGHFRGDGDLGFTETWRYRIQDVPLYRKPNGDDQPFFNMASASSAWADFDGDGSLDLLFTRADGYYPDSGIVHPRNELWFNDGSGNLTNSGIILPALAGASVAVGDLFNHGRNDILISGATDVSQSSFFDPADYRTVLLRNEGGGVFTAIELDRFGVVEMTGRGLALADYDQDGRLDALMAGFNSKLAHFNVLRNTMDIPSNAPPAAPSGLATTVGDGTVTFRWSHATDDITPTNLLTYNLRVGTNPLGTEAVSPMANVTSGWRKIAAPGNVAHSTNILYRLPPGTYYWSLQAVDGAFAGSAWATEQSFTITNAEPVRLQIAMTNAVRALNWPIRHLDFAVDEQADLGESWSSNGTPITNLNGRFTVPVTNLADDVRFYRLRK